MQLALASFDKLPLTLRSPPVLRLSGYRDPDRPGAPVVGILATSDIVAEMAAVESVWHPRAVRARHAARWLAALAAM